MGFNSAFKGLNACVSGSCPPTALCALCDCYLLLYHVAPTFGGHSDHLCVKTSSIQTSTFTADNAVEHPAFTADFNGLMFVRELFHFAAGELLSVWADNWPAG